MRFERRKACHSDDDGAALDGDVVLMVVVVLMVIAVRVLELPCDSSPLIL